MSKKMRFEFEINFLGYLNLVFAFSERKREFFSFYMWGRL